MLVGVLERDAVLELVRNLGSVEQTRFAGFCADRLLPCLEYASAIRNERECYSEVSTLLDDLWDALSTAADIGVRSRLSHIERYVPNEDDPWNAFAPLVENAVRTVIYFGRSVMQESPDSAVWTATQCHEAIDYIVHAVSNIDFGAQVDEALALAHPLMQEELGWEASDIGVLTQYGSATMSPSLVREMRQLARRRGLVVAEMAKRVS